MLPLSQLPENPCCYSTGQCCSPLRTARDRNRFPALVRSSVEPFFWNLEFWSKTPKRSFFGPLLLRYWCTNPCCSTTAQFVFLVRVARYANHFSSLIGSPKIPFCWVHFLSSRTRRMRLIFCSHSANFPKIHAAIVQASAAHHCELPGLGTVFLLSFVRPKNHFLESRILVKNAKTLLFWAAAAPPLVHQSMLLYYCPVCLPSESCHICKPFL